MPSLSKPHYDTDRLNGIPFSSVVEQLDTLKRKGCRYVTYCPWHDDKHPSLTLYEGTGENRCHCFACGNGGSVINYVMSHEGMDFLSACAWLSNTFGVGEDSGSVRKVHYKKPRQERVEPMPTFIPMHFVEDMASLDSSFCRCMRLLFNPELVAFIAEEYRLGIYRYWGLDDCVAFPSIDQWGNVHNIKVQHYCTDMTSAKFCHSDCDGAVWLGSCLVKQGLLPAGSMFSTKCLFGEHLLQKYPTATVALTESPKNALFGAAALPQFVWVATGNKSDFKAENIPALQGRDVVVYPDHDAYEEWEMKAKQFQYVANFTMAENCKKSSVLGSKYDIADIIVDWRMRMPF